MPRSLAGAHNPWLIAVVVSMATFMEVLDTTIVNVSLRHIAGSLSASYDQSTWVLTSYLVSNAIIMPISGWLAGVMGRKRFYLSCVAIFTVSSLLCGLAPSLAWLVIFRVLQGAGGGGLTPSSLSILRDSFPEAKTGMVYALYGVVVVAAPALGPTLGGYITDHYSWHWVFFINIPIGIAAFWLSWTLLVEPPIETKERKQKRAAGLKIDYWGFFLVAIGLGTLQIVLDKGQEADWFSATYIVVLALIASLSLAGLIVREFTAHDPIVDLPLLKDRSFLAVNILRLGVFFVLLGTTQLLPQLVQLQMGYSAEQAGLVITPGALLMILMMPVVGWLVNRIQPRYLIGAGLAVLSASMFYMSGFTESMGFWHIAWARCFQSAGLSLLIVPINSVAYMGMPQNKSANASALINLTRNIGGAFGISLAQTWLVRRSQFHQSRLVDHVSLLNPQTAPTLKRIEEMFHLHGGALYHSPMTTALGLLYRQVQRQATMLSYNDIFWLMGFGTAAMIPLIFLMRAAKPGQAAAASDG
jgi:DHA2 family multidrug resistance protein